MQIQKLIIAHQGRSASYANICVLHDWYLFEIFVFAEHCLIWLNYLIYSVLNQHNGPKYSYSHHSLFSTVRAT